MLPEKNVKTTEIIKNMLVGDLFLESNAHHYILCIFMWSLCILL